MSILEFKNIAWNISKKLANLNLSIAILLLIALLSVIGTIIEQEQDVRFYQLNYPLNNTFFTWKLILNLGLDHIYTTWWFIFLLVIFFLSLLICTLSKQLPGLNNARNWKFLQQNIAVNSLAQLSSLYQKSLSNIIFSLNKQNYYVFHKGKSIYGYKGLVGRISPIFVHISIVLILIGSVTGLVTGFTIQEMIPCHEIVHFDNIIKAGARSYLPKNILAKVNDFVIVYDKKNSVKQFISNVKLINSQNVSLCDHKIKVNKPLLFNGITFYQTDWRLNALRFQIGKSQIIQQKINKVSVGNTIFWACKIPITPEEQILLVIRDLKQNIVLYNLSGELLNEMGINEYIVINNTSLVIKELLVSTGLQIKTDPGITIVYIGFFILIISVITSYISYSQIWVTSKAAGLSLSGSTNRAILSFEEDFVAIQQRYINYTFSLATR